ncbi:MAG: tetratricopeptide repeat protein [Deltaproteobacteria bacterium]|nr:tetratricopeptide repeat protein [Deltaproteobacteria bacterium]
MERTKSKLPAKRQSSPSTREALLAREAGDIDKALALAKSALSEQASGEAHAVIAWALAARGDLDSALVECERALACDPQCALALSDLGHYLIERGDFDNAASYLERAFESGATSSRVHYDWGRVSAQRGMLKRAAQAYRDALAVDPSYQLAADGLMQVTQSLN